MKAKKIAAIFAATAMTASALAVSASAYDGYIQFQNSVYTFRNDYNDVNYGRDADNDAFNNVIVWGQGKEPWSTFPDYADYFDEELGDNGGYLIPVDYTDVEITADGTYTVSLEGFDWTLDGTTSFNSAGVSTDIPKSTGAYISSASLIVDGEAVITRDGLTAADLEEGANTVILRLINIYNSDLEKYSGKYPTSSLAVQFTIAGLGAAETATTTATTTTTAAAGDVQAATDSSKGSPDTGIEGVAAIAGLAIAAGAGIALTRKRK